MSLLQSQRQGVALMVLFHLVVTQTQRPRLREEKTLILSHTVDGEQSQGLGRGGWRFCSTSPSSQGRELGPKLGMGRARETGWGQGQFGEASGLGAEDTPYFIPPSPSAGQAASSHMTACSCSLQ